MMITHTNLTKHLLAEALGRALQSKPFHKITVTELVNDCQINRQTFYYHFQDIYDLLQWFLRQRIQEIQQQSIQTDGPLIWQDRLRIFLTFVQSNLALCQNITNSLGRDILEGIFYDAFYTVIEDLVVSYWSNNPSATLPKDLPSVIRFYTLGLGQMVIQWVKQSMPQSIDGFIAQIEPLIRYTALGIKQTLLE